MAVCEHYCKMCGAQFMDNSRQEVCPVCKSPGITNWMEEQESPYGDDYESFIEDEE